MDREDLILKQYLEQNREILSADTKAPDTQTYYRYIAGELSGPEEQRVIRYLLAHKEAQELVLKAKELVANQLEADKAEVPSALLSSVTKPAAAKASAGNKTGQSFRILLFYGLSSLFLLLSFVVHRYYMQFLLLAALFGLKAILDQRAHKTQVLVYKALKDQSQKESGETEKNRRF